MDSNPAKTTTSVEWSTLVVFKSIREKDKKKDVK